MTCYLLVYLTETPNIDVACDYGDHVVVDRIETAGEPPWTITCDLIREQPLILMQCDGHDYGEARARVLSYVKAGAADDAPDSVHKTLCKRALYDWMG